MNKTTSTFLSIIICTFFIFASMPTVLTKNLSLANTNSYDYYSYQQMTDLLKNLQKNHEDIMKLESLGKTYEGRDIWMIKLSDNVELDEKEPGILLIGAHHGDEKISFEILIFYIDYMVKNYTLDNADDDNDGFVNEDPIDGKDNDNDGQIDEDPSEERVRNSIDNTQIFIVPMLNPDGVEANSRKNCNPNSRTGVNINRNYGYDWIYYDLFPGQYGEIWANEETSGNYKGPYGYSENETKAIKKLAESVTINISLSYHSGAEVVFYPWYHTTAKTLHENLFISIGEDMAEISGYPLWTGTDTVFPKPGGTLGTSENFLYGEHKILAYTVESARQKAPTNPTLVYNKCFKNVGVHLYLCEKAQTIDNKKQIKTRVFDIPFLRVLSLLHKILH